MWGGCWCDFGFGEGFGVIFGNWGEFGCDLGLEEGFGVIGFGESSGVILNLGRVLVWF